MFRGRPASILITALVLSAISGFCLPAALPQSVRTKSDADISKIGHRKIVRDPNFYSHEQETKLGKQLAQEVERSSKLVDDPVVVTYINQLGQKIVHNSDAHFPITIRVLDASTIDSVTLPGGFQYINKGLILQAETEGELASALAYGIASTALGAGTREATKGEITQLATVPLIQLGPGGWAGVGIYEASSLTISLMYLKFRRDFVFDADYFALQYLYKSGYDPESMPRFFERAWPLMLAGRKPAPNVLSPFPTVQDRLRAMRAEIQKILPHRDNATVSTSDFEIVKEHLRSWNPPNPKDPAATKPTSRKLASNSSSSSQLP